MTLHDALAAGRARLVAAGIALEEAAIDVDLYACTILGWDHARLLTEFNQPCPPDLEPRFSQWIARRERREPSAYIVGHREFWGLEFRVTPAVLIPRPETEIIVEEAVTLFRDADGMRMAEIGTGSGCISVSIAHDLPGARITATDISDEALAIARENAERHGVAERVAFVRSSYLNAVAGPFQAIVANPPYVKESDAPGLSRQVAGYEPHVALFGGRDGLRDIKGVLDAAREKLTSDGWLIFEFGLGQDEDVGALVRGYEELRLVRVRDDLQGIPRTAVVQRYNR